MFKVDVKFISCKQIEKKDKSKKYNILTVLSGDDTINLFIDDKQVTVVSDYGVGDSLTLEFGVFVYNNRFQLRLNSIA